MEKFDPFSSISNLLTGELTATKRCHLASSIYLEEAPNEVEFIEGVDFLGAPTLFPAQYEIVRDFFELLCPQCNDLDRIHKVKDVPREDQILFEYDVCPNCRLEKSTVYSSMHQYNELIGVLGMRSGKSSLAACISASIIHKLLCIENFQEALGMIKTNDLFYSYVATSKAQTAETVYGIFRGMYDASPWFQKHKKMLIELERTDPNLKKESLYKEKEDEINFKYKHLVIQSLHSNSQSLWGRTRIGAVIDEIAHFDSGESKRSANEIYRSMKNALTTVDSLIKRKQEQGIFTFPIPRLLSISSPMYSEDKAMQLLKESERQPKMLGVRMATWEANPTIKREDLEERYISDPLGAERDFGANPPGAENPLITDHRLIDLCVDKNKRSIFTIREKFFDITAQNMVFNYVSIELVDIKFNNLLDYVVHCDPGRKKDSFCLAIGHREGDHTIIDGAIEARPIYKGNVQNLIPREVFFPAMTDIILHLKKVLTLRAVSYDHWNSAEQIDRLRHAGIQTAGATLDREDHVRFAEDIRAQKIKLLPREDEYLDPRITRNMPAAKAIIELKALNDDGKRVDHPVNGTNDMIQCYIGVHRLLNFPEKVFGIKNIEKLHRQAMRRIKQSRGVGKVIRLKRFV